MNTYVIDDMNIVRKNITLCLIYHNREHGFMYLDKIIHVD
jgi:hypothetical protein